MSAIADLAARQLAAYNAADLDAFGSFAMTVVRRLPGIREMHSSLVLREIKAPGTLPLPRAG